MTAFRLFLRVVSWLSFAVWIALVFYNPPLPAPADVLPEIKADGPRQAAASLDELSLDIGSYRYTLKPSHRYDLEGVVVSLYDSDSWFDLTHQDDPGNIRDFCVVWGKNVSSGSYRHVTYQSGEFTCSFSWPRTLDPPFDVHAASNNHVLPANDAVARTIRSVRRGDQIRLRGHLTDYAVQDAEGKRLYTRNTSTSRDDRGGGACEIVYVTELEILKAADRLPSGARSAALWTLVGVLLLRLALVLILPMGRRPGAS